MPLLQDVSIIAVIIMFMAIALLWRSNRDHRAFVTEALESEAEASAAMSAENKRLRKKVRQSEEMSRKNESELEALREKMVALENSKGAREIIPALNKRINPVDYVTLGDNEFFPVADECQFNCRSISLPERTVWSCVIKSIELPIDCQPISFRAVVEDQYGSIYASCVCRNGESVSQVAGDVPLDIIKVESAALELKIKIRDYKNGAPVLNQNFANPAMAAIKFMFRLEADMEQIDGSFENVEVQPLKEAV